ncbi:PDI-like 1-1 [Artemisia annua]|uniref:PDI-like 1-1 n=1 Tax=Artemisia annua TaxID=35608 RepID=A0A2U1KXE2_ARTAN|nr:PDI-like 1-1 [Artemisia annua]
MVRRLCCRSEELFARILITILLTSFIISSYALNTTYLQIQGEYVLTLDHSNFTQVVSDHNFLVLQFYAPWSVMFYILNLLYFNFFGIVAGLLHSHNISMNFTYTLHSLSTENMNRLLYKFVEELEPEYEKAAWVLSTHEPPIVMAKIDGSAQENKEISREFEITGYPTIVILQNGGRDFHYYAGPRDVDGLVKTLERLIRPPSIEIKTTSDALAFIDDEKISIVGIFPTFSGEEFENFTAIANQVLWDSWDYDFYHTTDASLIPRGESSSLTTKPALRLLKPFDELFVDSQNFHVRDMENFIIEASIPLVTIVDYNNNNPPKIKDWISQLPDEQALLYLDFESDDFDVFKSKYHNIAPLYKCKGLRFLLGNAKTNEDDFKYSGLRFDQVPLIIIHSYHGSSYMKPNLRPDDIAPWLNDYKEGKLKPFYKSQPIPETNDEPLKVVVADSLQDMVLNLKKNVLLDIDVPSCRRFREFAPFIPELAVLFENDDDIMIARLVTFKFF